MDYAKMKEETKNIAEVQPTTFTGASCSFWATALLTFKRNLPDNHKVDGTISVEAVEAFKRCFGQEPTVYTYTPFSY